MELSKYEVFLKTVELGNITRAADVLGYTQPAVSRVITDLEREWGIPLLIRSRGGVKLTTEGQQLLPSIRAVCCAQRDLEASVSGLLGLTRGSVRIATFHSVAAHWLPQIVQSFLSLYPNIEFDISCELEYSSSELKLIQGDVDCAFVTLPLNIHANPPLRTIFLKRDPIYVALPLNHPLATAPAYPVSRFAEDALIYIRETHDRDITTIFDCCNVHPNTRYFMEDSYAIASMVESGMGVGIINGLIASRMPYHIALIPMDPPQYRDIALAVRSQGTLSPVLSRFLEYVQSWVAEHVK